MGEDIEYIVVSNGKAGLETSLADMYDALGVRYVQ